MICVVVVIRIGHDIEAMQVCTSFMNFHSMYKMLRTMLSVKSPTYDMVNCGLQFMIKSVMYVSFLLSNPGGIHTRKI